MSFKSILFILISELISPSMFTRDSPSHSPFHGVTDSTSQKVFLDATESASMPESHDTKELASQLSVQVTQSASPSPYQILQTMVSQQKSVCYQDDTCHPSPSINSPCCGHCTCDIGCFERGSCCLEMFSDFDHIQEVLRKKRYSCVQSQFLTSETDFSSNVAYWMITTCDPEQPDKEVSDDCEVTDDSDYDSLVPVTDLLTNKHYRSRNCARCNRGYKDTTLVNWSLQIKSNVQLSFPHNHLFERIRATRGNVFFKPPEYASTAQCEPPEYTVETCNVTGLWEKYDEFLVKACESYIDPFNNTYKNLFCNLCNENNRVIRERAVLGNCISRRGNYEMNSPRFTAVLELPYIKNGPGTKKLFCEGSQFPDEITMNCRDVLCHEHSWPNNGVCEDLGYSFDDTCFYVFLKLTPIQGTPKHKLDPVDLIQLQQESDRKFKTGTENVRLRRDWTEPRKYKDHLQIFPKTDGLGYIQYFVFYIIKIFSTGDQKMKFLEDIVNSPIFESTYSHPEISTKFSVEIALYNLTTSDNITRIIVPQMNAMQVDELVTQSDAIRESMCDNKEVVEVTKLHWCPYIVLDHDEFSMTIENDFLTISFDMKENRTFKVLSKWAYEVKDGSYRVCLQDYLEFYFNIHEAMQETTVSEGHRFKLSFWMFLFLILLKLFGTDTDNLFLCQLH